MTSFACTYVIGQPARLFVRLSCRSSNSTIVQHDDLLTTRTTSRQQVANKLATFPQHLLRGSYGQTGLVEFGFDATLGLLYKLLQKETQANDVQLIA